MRSKLHRKNDTQILVPRQSVKTKTDENSVIDKENVTEVSIVENKITRQKNRSKPLQEKTDNTKKAIKMKQSKPTIADNKNQCADYSVKRLSLKRSAQSRYNTAMNSKASIKQSETNRNIKTTTSKKKLKLENISSKPPLAILFSQRETRSKTKSIAESEKITLAEKEIISNVTRKKNKSTSDEVEKQHLTKIPAALKSSQVNDDVALLHNQQTRKNNISEDKSFRKIDNSTSSVETQSKRNTIPSGNKTLISFDKHEPTTNRKKNVPKIQRQNSMNKTKKHEIAVKSSTELVYKKNFDPNSSKTVSSIFEFESNSQEKSIDEPMKDVIDKLLREKKAIVVRGRKTKRKGATKAKKDIPPSKAVVKNPLLRLLDMKKFTPKAIKETVGTSSYENAKQIVENINRLDVHEEIAMSPHETTKLFSKISAPKAKKTNLSLTQGNTKQLPRKLIPKVVYETTISTHETNNQLSHSPIIVPASLISKPISTEVNLGFLNNESRSSESMLDHLKGNMSHTVNVPEFPANPPISPTKLTRKTYSHHKLQTKSIEPLYQSTPVRTETNVHHSPWRVLDRKLPITAVELEFSKINRFGENKDDMKENEGTSISKNRSYNHGQPSSLTTNQTLGLIQEIEKSKGVLNDIENCFGFIDDEIDNEELAKETISGDNNKDVKQKERGKLSPRKNVTKANVSVRKIITSKLKGKLPRQTETKYNAELTQPIPEIIQRLKKVSAKKKIVGDSGKKLQVKETIKTNKTRVNDTQNKLTNLLALNTDNPCSSKNVIFSNDTEGLGLFESNWLDKKNKKLRNYTRVPRLHYNRESIITDDENEYGDIDTHRHIKRTKTKVDHQLEEEIERFAEQFNSDCREVEDYDLVMEVSQ